MKFPKIQDPAMFEMIARDTLEIKLNTNLSIYGSKGQKQNGIDLYTSELDRCVVQCKDYLSYKSVVEMEKIIRTELNKTKGLAFEFTKFWIATALNRDINIQNMIECIQQEFKVNIYIFFWNDIEEILSNHVEIVRKYYPEYLSQEKNVSALLSLGYFSQVFSDYIELMCFGRTDALTYCDLVENGLSWFQNLNTKNTLLANLNAVRGYLTGPLSLVDDFKRQDVFFWCQNIQQNIMSIQNTINREDIVYFRIGMNLGSADHALNFSEKSELSFNTILQLKAMILQLQISAQDSNKINELIDKLGSENAYNIPSIIYDYICNRI